MGLAPGHDSETLDCRAGRAFQGIAQGLGDGAMKMTVFVFCLLCTTAALGQSIGYPTMGSTYQMVNHEQHATAHAMAQEHNLLEGTGGVYTAQGEMPLAEVPLPQKPVTPLGDVARMLRKQHETVKKAQFVYQN
jgi:hypothetical protein